MIEVEKAEKYRCCNVCNSQQKVFNITFWAKNTNSRTQVSLCEKCLNELKIKIAELEDFEWCHDCKEYDQEKHCCHRWTKVIRNTVEEIKTNYWRWIPVTEALPENRNVVLVTVYWHETYQVMMASYYGDGLWWCVPYNNCGKHMQKLNPIAWMPLPEGYRGEE